MKDERDWEEGWYEEGDKTTILAMNQAQYGDVALSQEAYFNWVYASNPMGPPIIPVARDKETGKVVGFAMFVPMRVAWSGAECPALLGYNMLVEPAYRRQGIQTKVSAVGPEIGEKQGYEFFYVIPNPTSLMGLVKLDYHVVSQIPMVIRPLDVAALTETYVGKRLMRWGVNLGWEVARRTLCRVRCRSQNGLPMRIVEDTEFDEGYDCFWDQIKTNYRTWREKGWWIRGGLWFGFDVTHARVVGTEELLVWMADDPELVKDIFNTELDCSLQLLDMIWDES